MDTVRGGGYLVLFRAYRRPRQAARVPALRSHLIGDIGRSAYSSVRLCTSQGSQNKPKPLVGKLGFAQVELPLDAAARFVLQFAAAEEIVHPSPLGVDQQALDLL